MKTNKEYWEIGIKKIKGEIISKGKFGGSILYNILELCDKYFHIHIEESFYEEGSDNSYWMDIEGIGYGWKWLRCEDENGKLDEQKNHDMLVDHIKRTLEFIINKHYDDTLWYIHSKENEVERIVIYNQTNDGVQYEYAFSDKELW